MKTQSDEVQIIKPSREYNSRAAKGQALNLAVHTAIAVGKVEDTKYIMQKFLHYYTLGNVVQELTIEEIQEEVRK